MISLLQDPWETRPLTLHPTQVAETQGSPDSEEVVGNRAQSPARAAGEHGMQVCLFKAQEAMPDFAERAEQAILDHLRIVRQCPGEVLTDVARAKGARPHDDRAFGAVFKRLAKRGAIRCVGFCERTKGHGTAGGRIWGLAG